jgi:exodeoxyribonuclease VII small subunit
MAKRDQASFEDLYRKLEETVEQLERGGLSLEESIRLYEQGMELAKRCQAILNAAEQRITKLREAFAQDVAAAEAAASEEVVIEDIEDESLEET